MGKEMTIEERLIKYIKDHGYKMTVIADKSGVGLRLRRVFYEGARLKADDLIAVTKALGISVEDLLND